MDAASESGFSDQAARDRAALGMERRNCWRSQARAWLGRIRGDQASVQKVAAESSESVQRVAETVVAYLEEQISTYNRHPHGKAVMQEIRLRLQPFAA